MCIWLSYLFNLRRERLFRSASDLPHKLIQLPLAQHAIALAFELERRRARDDRLTHGSRRTVSGTAHSGSCLAHVNSLWGIDSEMARNRHFRVV